MNACSCTMREKTSGGRQQRREGPTFLRDAPSGSLPKQGPGQVKGERGKANAGIQWASYLDGETLVGEWERELKGVAHGVGYGLCLGLYAGRLRLSPRMSPLARRRKGLGVMDP